MDIEDIGALAVPVPTLRELSETISARFGFLQNLTDEEKIVAQIREQDRALVLKMMGDLPGGRLFGIGLY